MWEHACWADYPRKKLDMWTARQRLKSPRSLSGTSAHPTMVTLVNIMVMNGWLTSFSFLRYSNFRLWPWNSKVKVMGVVQGQYCTVRPVSYQLTSFSFHINQTNKSWDTAILKFDLETSKVKVMSQRSRSHILPSIKPIHFLFVSYQSDQSFLNYGQNSVWPWKNTSKIFKEICQNNSFNRSVPKSNQVITMTRAIKLLCFVVIQWVVLTLLYRQANLC